MTFIVADHYMRIFNSWGDAYRYMDWFLTVPLLLLEILLVMSLRTSRTPRTGPLALKLL